MRAFNFIFASLIATTTWAQTGNKVQHDKIFGLWQDAQFGYQMSLILNPDGSGEFDGQAIKFITQGNKLSITVDGTTTGYTYVLNGNTMTLAGGDLDGQVNFTRSGAGEVKGNQGPAFSGTSSKLIGLWSGNGEMIEFRSDGKCFYLGNTFPYQVSHGYIVLTSGQGNVSFAYSVSGTQLTLTANGQNVIYNKAAGPGTNNPTVNNANTKGSVAMELVGTWCYMNMQTNSQTSRCITLNADGSYLYHTESSRSVITETVTGGTSSQGDDRGSWYVQGDRIYYNSPTSGQGSYRLEKRNHPKNVNDPMIVLDGESFVTTTLRPPWK